MSALAAELGLAKFAIAATVNLSPGERADEWREAFQSVGCRGFSYELDFEMKRYNRQYIRPCQLDKRIDLRLAMVPGEDVFYPPRVLRYLKESDHSANHYLSDNGLPSIAFCLGQKRQGEWFVFIMQSDLASAGPAYVRDYFRGWRKVLFANIAARARQSGAALYICPAEHVARACYPGSKELGQAPDHWKIIYAQTASEWNMPLVAIPHQINVRIYRSKPPVYCQSFYKMLPYDPVISRSKGETQEAACAAIP
jgi:hypothetical protein